MRTLRRAAALFLFLLIMVGYAGAASAAPYEGYNYSFWSETKAAPLAYLPDRTIDGEKLGIGAFNNPEDFTVSSDGHIYVADTGNNRIVVISSDLQVERIITGFRNGTKDDGLSEPAGIFVNDKQQLYIADTGNKRIVVLTTEGAFVKEISAPKSDVLRQGFVYVPTKVVADSADRVYVISKGGFDGIVQFDSGGQFTGFIGLSQVQFNPVDLFWKRISTKEQRSKMQLFIPSEFNNVDIDADGFIYATSAEVGGTPVRRLNAAGVDVLRRDGYSPIQGDIHLTNNGTRTGPSTFVSVAVDESGIYNCLDSKRGRIFTYDRDGNLLYEFGSLGEQFGNFKTPVELDTMGSQVLVLDKGFSQLTVFSPTRYGKAVRDASIYTDIGDEDKAQAAWAEAKKYNGNLEIAYTGVGKTELREGNNLQAMESFKLGMNRAYYSRAFERYRKEWMWNHFGLFAGVTAAVVAGLVLVARRRKAIVSERGVIGTAWETVFHPFRGFWEAKYDGKGSVWLALGILLLLALLSLVKQQYSGYIFNMHADTESQARTIDAFEHIVLPFFLWCVANWSLTTLMDGEGTFKDIITASGYALVPLVLVQIPLIVLSNILTLQEASFYSLLQNIAAVWFVWLIFAGQQTMHQYTVKKTLLTMLLILVVIGIFLFIGMLFFSLLNEILSFATTVYKEIMFRIQEG